MEIANVIEAVDSVGELSSTTYNVGISIAFFSVIMLVFLIISVVFIFRVPKTLDRYFQERSVERKADLEEKREQRKYDIERDNQRWAKHIDITERAIGVESQVVDLMLQVRNELETTGNELKEVSHSCTHNMECFDEMKQNQKAIQQMLTEVYNKLEETKRVQAEEKEIIKVTKEMNELKIKIIEMTRNMKEKEKE